MPRHSSASTVLGPLYADKTGKLPEEKSFFADLIGMLSYMLDLEEPRKLYHAWRVSIVASKMAKVILPDQRAEVHYAALLHDIGVVGFADQLAHASLKGKDLKIPGIWNHPSRGAEIVARIPGLIGCTRFIQEHHEWYNGEGYPNGKRGNEIAVGSRIIRIADSFDVYLQNRSQISWMDVKIHFQNQLGQEFPQQIHDCFVEVMDKDNLFHALTSNSRLPGLLEQIQAELPLIAIPPGTDAIGTTLQVFAEVIDAKHRYTKGHSARVAKYAVKIAKKMKLPHDDVTKVKWAALLHDAGKIAVPRSILDKPGALTSEEFEVIKLHPKRTEEILKMIDVFHELASIAGHHHERYDGKGYPDKLRREEIPLLARILAVSDAFDGITSARPYQETRTSKQAIRILHENAGTQFDPRVVAAASTILGRKVI